ncbi:FadR/GntR family transcriptional regulator [Roseobacter litoralis]|uniref:FadR/GntR family transcriptional regulator n=1 Tax=Roseobacter litoralis TaxID=42443 RepID=UPI002492F677|nr:FCD domain-containing protein [Roseobacter litoralis]
MSHVKRLPPDQTKALMGDVSRRSVREVIAEKLAALISSGVLAVGDELPGERELATSLSVSRETVRGAIAILASHRILRVAHGARTTVATADVRSLVRGVQAAGFEGPYDLESVHEARLLVERRIAADAARNINEVGLAKLRASIVAQEESGDDPVRFLLCDRDFHATLYRAAGNDVFFDVAMSLYNHLLDHRRRIVAKPGAIAESLSDHRAILTAMENGNPEMAERSVVGHATRIYLTTRAFLDGTSPNSADSALE